LKQAKRFGEGFIVSNKAPKASYEVAETQTIAESLTLQTFNRCTRQSPADVSNVF